MLDTHGLSDSMPHLELYVGLDPLYEEIQRGPCVSGPNETGVKCSSLVLPVSVEDFAEHRPADLPSKGFDCVLVDDITASRLPDHFRRALAHESKRAHTVVVTAMAPEDGVMSPFGALGSAFERFQSSELTCDDKDEDAALLGFARVGTVAASPSCVEAAGTEGQKPEVLANTAEVKQNSEGEHISYASYAGLIAASMLPVVLYCISPIVITIMITVVIRQCCRWTKDYRKGSEI